MKGQGRTIAPALLFGQYGRTPCTTEPPHEDLQQLRASLPMEKEMGEVMGTGEVLQ